MNTAKDPPISHSTGWAGGPVCGTLTGEAAPALDWQSTLLDIEESCSTVAALMSLPFLSTDERMQDVTPEIRQFV